LGEVGEGGGCVGTGVAKKRRPHCGCLHVAEACLPVILEMPTRHDTICKGEGQQESREHTNCKRTRTSRWLIGPIYHQSVVGQELDVCRNKVKEGREKKNSEVCWQQSSAAM